MWSWFTRLHERHWIYRLFSSVKRVKKKVPEGNVFQGWGFTSFVYMASNDCLTFHDRYNNNAKNRTFENLMQTWRCYFSMFIRFMLLLRLVRFCGAFSIAFSRKPALHIVQFAEINCRIWTSSLQWTGNNCIRSKRKLYLWLSEVCLQVIHNSKHDATLLSKFHDVSSQHTAGLSCACWQNHTLHLRAATFFLYMQKTGNSCICIFHLRHLTTFSYEPIAVFCFRRFAGIFHTSDSHWRVASKSFSISSFIRRPSIGAT